MNEEEYDIGWSNRTGKDLAKIERYLKENASDAVADKVIRALFNAVEPARTFRLSRHSKNTAIIVLSRFGTTRLFMSSPAIKLLFIGWFMAARIVRNG